MKKVWLVILAALLLVPTAAQAQTIRGTVVEEGTGTPIAGARVQLEAAGASGVMAAQTDSAGAFLLRPRRPGSFTLRVTHPSYAAVDSVALSAQPGETVQLELQMGRSPIPLEPVVVTTRPSRRLTGFYERTQRPGFGRFLTRADIELRRGASTTQLLYGMPGVEIVRVAPCPGCAPVNLIFMRGGVGRCMPTIYIDGMPVRQFPESGLDSFLNPAMLEGVEVYTGLSAPSPIHSRDGCGVVAFWSREVEGGRWSWTKVLGGVGGFVLLVALTRWLGR